MAIPSTNDSVSSRNSRMKNVPEDVVLSFKNKASFMKSWIPASSPSNRDRLELYSLHKQAVSGDAPAFASIVQNNTPGGGGSGVGGSGISSNASISSSSVMTGGTGTGTPAERAKYNAWKSKTGLSSTEAMRRYIIECDRQVGMYGTAITATNTTGKDNNNNNNNNNNTVRAIVGSTGSQQQQQQQYNQQTTTGTSTSSTTAAAAASSAYQTATATAASTTLRGLAAIPLICAAASEDRQSYLRRLQNSIIINGGGSNNNGFRTTYNTNNNWNSSNSSSNNSTPNNNNNTTTGTTYSSSWWKRQEPLTAQPGTFLAIPEHILLTIASFVETISLNANYIHYDDTYNNNSANTSTDIVTSSADATPADDGDEILGNNNRQRQHHQSRPYNIFASLLPPAAVIQSFLWPVHNTLLAIWIEIILLHAIVTGAIDCIWTVLWGSKRTGKTLTIVWKNHIRLACIQSMYTITDQHQPITCRCVGLLLWPAHIIVNIISIVTIDDNNSNNNDNNSNNDSGYNNVNSGTTSYTNNNNNNNSISNSYTNANIWTCLFYTSAIGMTLWYWISLIPFITFICLCTVFWIGGSCFALIELAGV